MRDKGCSLRRRHMAPPSLPGQQHLDDEGLSVEKAWIQQHGNSDASLMVHQSNCVLRERGAAKQTLVNASREQHREFGAFLGSPAREPHVGGQPKSHEATGR